MNEQALRERLSMLTVEMCLKMGGELPGLLLNLPTDSLYRTLECDKGELWDCLRSFGGVVDAGDTEFSEFEGAVCVKLSPEAVHELWEKREEYPFLMKLVAFCGTNPSIKELVGFFRQEGEPSVFKINDPEFDLLIFYPSGKPDASYYCVKDEGVEVDYHRFTKEDFEAFGYDWD